MTTMSQPQEAYESYVFKATDLNQSNRFNQQANPSISFSNPTTSLNTYQKH